MEDPIDMARERMLQILAQVSEENQLTPAKTDKLADSFAEIMEELAVVSEELRQQNEELIDARNVVEQERQRYQDLFEYAPDAYVITDAKGLIQDANQAAANLLNMEKHLLAGKPILVFFGEEDLTMVSRILRSGEAIRNVEISVRPYHIKKAYVSITTNLVPGANGQPAQVRWILRDVTERHNASASLDASEQRFRTIFDQSNLGIVLLDLNGMILRANRAFLDMLGSRSDDLPDHFFALLECSDEEVKTLTGTFQNVARGQPSPAAQKTRFLGPGGRPFWGSVTLSPLRSEKRRINFIVAMVENITAEHDAEVELAEMRRRLLESGEAERLRLAQELHDGPMQDLYGAVFHLTNLPALEEDPESQERIRDVQEILKRVAGTLRTICGELRPPTLTNLGLERAIRSHAERVHDQHPEINLQLELTSESQALPPHVRMALFRIYQQCMTNVLRHSQASKVMISFHVNENEALLDVWDNGKGFTLPEKWVELLREGHYGLAGIAERVIAMQGALQIDTKPGAGTLVHVTVPLDHQEA